MDKESIRKILQNPSMEIVNIALGYVNLTEDESEVIKLVEMKGKTEERAAEILQMSPRNVQYIKQSAFKKLEAVWSKNLFISMLLERV